MLRVVAAVLMLCSAGVALAHDYANAPWIDRGFRSRTGQPCCGPNDCNVVHGVVTVTLPAPGYRLPSGEFIMEKDTLPSDDENFWRCAIAGSTRCFFSPRVRTQ